MFPVALLCALLAAAPSLRAEEAESPKLRLPEGVRPLRYDAELEIRPDQPTFRGTLDMELELRRSTALLWLNARSLTIERAIVDDVPGEVVEGHPGFVGVRLPGALPAGRAHLRLEYRGEMTDRESSGIFRQQERGDWYAYTQFEPLFARRAFPCFDEPSYKVPWKLALRIPRTLVAVSNTPVASEAELPEGMKRVAFAETRPLPSYLVAFGVGPFEFVDAGPAGAKRTPVRIVVPRGMAAQARYAAAVTPRLLQLAEEQAGLPYPYAKLDLLPVLEGGRFGAMENPGLITFSLPLVLARANEETARFRQTFAHVAAHEISHMWFGDLVTHAWWDDIWLNESFANWMSDHLIARFAPDWHIEAKSLHERDWAMKTDGLLSARRIRQPIESEDDVANAFDAITYAKGAAVLGMFESWLGEQRFRDALRGYLERHAHGNASAADLLGALQALEPRAGAALASFLEQPGLPIVSVDVHCSRDGASVALAQRRYLPLGSRGSDGVTWQIPVCLSFATASGVERRCFLLLAPSAMYRLGDSCPASVRADGPRYYRIAYRGRARPPRSAPLAERVAEAGDLRALAWSGTVPLDAALARFQGYAAGRERDVVQLLIGWAAELRPLVPEERRAGWRRWIGRVFGPQARALGVAPRPGESDDTLRLRPSLVSIASSDGDDARLRSEVSRLAARWLDSPGSIGDNNLAEVVLQAAARDGDRAFFERLTAALAVPRDRRERRILYLALGSFRDPELARAALELVLDPARDYREAVQIAWTQAETPEGAARVHEFAKANFDALAARAPQDAPAYYPRWAAALCSEAARADVEDFYGERAARFTGGPRVLAQTLEGISLCAAFKERQGPRLAAFLARQ